MSGELMKFVSPTDLRMILPTLIVAAMGVVMLMVQVLQRKDDDHVSRDYLAWLSVLGLSVAAVDTMYLMSEGVREWVFGHRLCVDGWSQMMNLLILLGAILTCLISPSYLADHKKGRGEYYALLMFSVVGMTLLTSGMDLFVLFVGAELMSLAMYGLVGFFKHTNRSTEATLKAFLLGAFASAIFLYGIALIYSASGTTMLVTLKELIVGGTLIEPAGVQEVTGAGLFKLKMLPGIGMVMVAVGLACKLALVPFHMWVPDTYHGAPSSVVAFLSTGVKVAVCAALVRVFCVAFFDQPARLSPTGWLTVFYWLSVASMVYGNLAAILQKNVKRLLAYLSIAHGGYIMVGVLAASWSVEHLGGLESLGYYLLAYTLAMVGAYGVLAYFGKRDEECQTLEDISGIAEKYPAIALAMTIFMMSLAGMPLTAGFMAKVYIFKAAAATGENVYVGLIVIGVLTSVVGVYCCLKVVVAMTMKKSRRHVNSVGGRGLKAALLICALLTLGIGVYPNVVVEQARKGVQGAVGISKPASHKGALLSSRGVSAEPRAAIGVPLGSER